MGDHVLARDDETGETGFRPVVRTYETPGLVVFDLVVAETCGQTDTLTVTYEHPFWVQDTGWIPAGQLVPGDQLVTADGDPATVLDRGVEARATTVHNVEVEELHTYFVGDQGVWVHNTSDDCDVDEAGTPGEWAGPTDYSHIKNPKNLANTKPTPRQVREMKKANRAHNGGELRDDVTGELMVESQKSRRGVKPPSNEAQIDHIKPVAKGGTRTNDNLQMRTRKNNRDKWDK